MTSPTMIIFRKSDSQHLILHDLLNHMSRTLTPSETEIVLKSLPQIQDPKIDSWLVSELPLELEEMRGRKKAD